MAKKKRSFGSIELIRMQYRRRIWRDIHVGAFFASQAAIWLWWFSENSRSGNGFHAAFFSDRLIVLVVWTMILLVHVWVTRLLNARDTQIAALLENQADDEDDVVVDNRATVSARRLEDFTRLNADIIDADEPERNHNHR